jgi:hypothetical protein
MTIQTGVILVCVAGALLFMGRKVWRALNAGRKGKGCDCGCGR